MYRFALPLLLLVACSSPAHETPTDDDAGAQPSDSAVPLPDAAPGDDGGQAPGEPCNGHVALCDRRYDEVVFPATHNAHAAQEYAYGELNANQISGLARQLDDGVRTMLLDVYEDAGEHVFCHGFCALGKTSHVAGLTLIAEFLTAHPREVFTIIYEDHLDVASIAEDLESSGLAAFAYSHEAGKPWPTLRTMIEAGTRLVVTLENGAPPPAYAQNVWTLAWDTPYSFASAADFSCALNRGARENALFLLNHWVGNGAGLPDEEGAKLVNAYDVLYGRAKGCWDETSDLPNFVAVDFYEHGDLFRVVDALNGL